MNLLYFGRRWDAPMLDDALRVPVPVGERCLSCEEVVTAKDRGFVRSTLKANGTGLLQPQHLECDLRLVLGHVYGVCGCTGYGTTRVEAQLVLMLLNRDRCEQGRDPL